MNNTGFTSCQACHGTALDGGSSGVSCDSCHTGWKNDCTFCHGGTDNATGAPPQGINSASESSLRAMPGKHKKHVLDKGVPCSGCHSANVSAAGTILQLDRHVDGVIDVNVTGYDANA